MNQKLDTLNMMNSRLVKYSVYTMMLIATVVFFVSCNKTPEETLRAIAQEAQRDCPLIMDEMTTMIKVEASPDMTLKYTYSSKKRIELNEDEKKMSVIAMKRILLGRLQIRQEIPFYQANDVTFEHNFFDEKKQLIIQVIIDPSDYK